MGPIIDDHSGSFMVVHQIVTIETYQEAQHYLRVSSWLN